MRPTPEQKAKMEVIYDLFVCRSKLITPVRIWEMQDIQSLHKYNFFDAVISQLLDKHDIDFWDMHDFIREMSIKDNINNNPLTQ